MPRAFVPVLALAALILVGGIVAIAVNGGGATDAPTATDDDAADQQATGEGDSLPDEAPESDDDTPAADDGPLEEDGDPDAETEAETEAETLDEQEPGSAPGDEDADPSDQTAEIPSDRGAEAAAEREATSDPDAETTTDADAPPGERSPRDAADDDGDWRTLALPETGGTSTSAVGLLLLTLVMLGYRQSPAGATPRPDGGSHRQRS